MFAHRLVRDGCRRLGCILLPVAVVVVVLAVCGCGGCDRGAWSGAGGPTLKVLVTTRALRQAELSTTGPYGLFIDERRLDGSSRPLRRRVVKRVGSSWLIGDERVRGVELVLRTTEGRFVALDGTYYRGELHLHPAAEGFFVVNHVDTESYLAGVLPKELYSHWSFTTYCAQAVAARTYALYKHMHSSGGIYDLVAGQADQVYGGASAETDKSRRAAAATRGWVLVWGPEGRERMFLAQYSACNGGVVNPAAVLRDAPDIPPLAGGQSDPDGRTYSRYTWRPVKVSKADIYKAVLASFPKADRLEGLAAVRIVEQTSYGRAVWLDLIGVSGKKIRIRAEDLRLCLLRNGPKQAKKIYSMNCRMRDLGDAILFYDGRGHGHGVGLSQWGAEEKARHGWDVRKILDFYYPSAKIVRAY